MKNQKFISILILAIAVLLAVLTRGYKLGYAPAGLNADEAGQGYSAYSILKTGKDEFGKSFPILFRSSGDFKTPVYTYLTIPSIAIFGLTPFSVRLSSAIFGVLTIPVLYLLIKELVRKQLSPVAAVAAILLAISPWHILYGRTAYECNLALFFFLSGCLSFYMSLKRPWILIISAILFAVAIPSYHSERIVIPLMLVILFLRYGKTLLSGNHLRYLIIGAILAFVITLPTLSIVRTPGFFARVDDLNIFTVNKPAGFLENYQGILEPIINNKQLLSIREFGFLYLSYFSPRYIFLLGDSGPRSSFPELSTFFVWQLPFYLYGLYLFIRKKELGELKFFTIVLLLVTPVPAALTRDPYSTTRAFQMVIPLTIIIAFAIIEVYSKLAFKRIFIGVFALLVIYSVLKLYSSVIILNEQYRSTAWEYGWKPVADTIKTLDTNLPVIVDNSRNVGYIQLAFFLRADPFLYQKQNFEIPPSEYYTNLRSNEIKKIDNITLRKINWENDLLIEQYLIGDKLAISSKQIEEHGLILIKDILYPDRSIAYRIVKTNP